jgi:hypothetical protein
MVKTLSKNECLVAFLIPAMSWWDAYVSYWTGRAKWAGDNLDSAILSFPPHLAQCLMGQGVLAQLAGSYFMFNHGKIQISVTISTILIENSVDSKDMYMYIFCKLKLCSINQELSIPPSPTPH